MNNTLIREMLNEIEARIAQLQGAKDVVASLLTEDDGKTLRTIAAAAGKGKRTMSAATRRRIAASAKKRWADRKKAQKKAAKRPAKKAVKAEATT